MHTAGYKSLISAQFYLSWKLRSNFSSALCHSCVYGHQFPGVNLAPPSASLPQGTAVSTSQITSCPPPLQTGQPNALSLFSQDMPSALLLVPSSECFHGA